MSTKKIATLGVSLALSLILSLVENALPPIFPALPYAKIGFSNFVILFLFIVTEYRYGFMILLLKCVLSALFAGAPTMMLYSIPSSLVGFAIMAVLLKSKKLSIIAISSVGAMLYNIVQLFVARFQAGVAVLNIAPYMICVGAAAGIITGITVWLIIKYIPEKSINLFEKV